MATPRFMSLLYLLSAVCLVVAVNTPSHPRGQPHIRLWPSYLDRTQGSLPFDAREGATEHSLELPSVEGPGEDIAASGTQMAVDLGKRKLEIARRTPDWPGGWRGGPFFGGGRGGGYPGEEGEGSSGGGESGSDTSSGSDFASQFLGFDVDRAATFRTAHGIIAAIVFAIVFPAGAILMRAVPGRFATQIHALVQVVGYAAYIAAAGLGIYLAQYVRIPTSGGTRDILADPSRNFHPIIGLVILTGLFLQPIFGMLHHNRFKKLRKRQVWSYFHLVIGRTFITLGIINGGLGLWISEASRSLKVWYGIVAGLFWCVWMVVALFTELKRRRSASRLERKRKLAGMNGAESG